MSEPETNPAQEPAVDPAPSPKDEKPVPQSVPYDRFSEVIAKGKAETARADAAEKKLKEQEADREKVRKKQLEEQGEEKTLRLEAEGKLATAEAKATEWDQYQSDRREALTKDLSDEDKAIAETIPDLSGLESFVTRIQPENLPSTDNRTSARTGQATLKPIAEMSDKEQRETHKERLGSYL